MLDAIWFPKGPLAANAQKYRSIWIGPLEGRPDSTLEIKIELKSNLTRLFIQPIQPKLVET